MYDMIVLANEFQMFAIFWSIKSKLSVFVFTKFVGKCLSIKGKGALEGIAYW